MMPFQAWRPGVGAREPEQAEKLKIHDQQPRYPEEALRKGIEGDVILLATIDTKGKIADLRVSKGDPILAKAAVDAVKHWRYNPYLLNGEAVEVETTILIKFHFRSASKTSFH
jgi:periplasmic protein TonB